MCANNWLMHMRVRAVQITNKLRTGGGVGELKGSRGQGPPTQPSPAEGRCRESLLPQWEENQLVGFASVAVTHFSPAQFCDVTLGFVCV